MAHHWDDSCQHGHRDPEHFSDQLLKMADEAWMELLKEKIKQKIEETTGPHLDKLAAIVAQANHDRWNNKMGIIRGKDTFESKLDDYFK